MFFDNGNQLRRRDNFAPTGDFIANDHQGRGDDAVGFRLRPQRVQMNDFHLPWKLLRGLARLLLRALSVRAGRGCAKNLDLYHDRLLRCSLLNPGHDLAFLRDAPGTFDIFINNQRRCHRHAVGHNVV